MPTPAGLRPSRVPALRLTDLARLAAADLRGPGGVGGDLEGAEHPDPAVTGVTLDSRAVRPGDLYAALPGANVHGAEFAGQVAGAGAVAALTDAAGAQRVLAAGLPALVVADPRAVLGGVAAAVYGEPSRDLTLLGVTGTNGKTTTTYLLEAALRAAGRTTGLIGTVETRVADDRVSSVRTTPESPDLHALFAVMRERAVDVCAMEVSSHALGLHRVDGVVYDVAGFTNLSQDHLDFHGSMEEYFAVKAALFTPERARRGVVVVDDAWGRELVGTASVPVVTVSTTGADADWKVDAVRAGELAGTTGFTLRHRDGRTVEAVSPLPGSFNVANTALAVLMLLEAGLSADEAARGLAAATGVPGRMERVVGPAGSALGVVDYAHTPDAVAAAGQALRGSTAGRLVLVLGAGGDRDPGKRAAMGAAAAAVADVVVVTDDNPRSEDPAAIRAAVLSGARAAAADSGAEVIEVADRRTAVRHAVGLTSGTEDTVLLAGKGHEQGQEVAGVTHPFDDREVLRTALEEAADR